MINSQSRHSARAVRTKRSAIAFAFGARTGVLMIRDPLACEDGVEVACELAVAIADQEAKRPCSLLKCPAELARLLGDPGAGRVRGAAAQVDAPAAELYEEKQEEAPVGAIRLDVEQLDGQHAFRL